MESISLFDIQRDVGVCTVDTIQPKFSGIHFNYVNVRKAFPFIASISENTTTLPLQVSQAIISSAIQCSFCNRNENRFGQYRVLTLDYIEVLLKENGVQMYLIDGLILHILNSLTKIVQFLRELH